MASHSTKSPFAIAKLVDPVHGIVESSRNPLVDAFLEQPDGMTANGVGHQGVPCMLGFSLARFDKQDSKNPAPALSI